MGTIGIGLEARIRQERIITRTLVKPRLKVKYPQVEGLSNGLVQKMVNHSIVEAVYDLIRRQGYVSNPTMEVTGDYELKLHKKELLSLLYENYGIAKLAAHGLTYKSSQTFNLEDGTEYSLSDLFKPGSDYVRRISEIIRREFKERDIPMLTEFTTIRENQDFYLTDHALGIYFQVYEYAPYVYGFPTFEIPYAELADIINTEGPIGRLM